MRMIIPAVAMAAVFCSQQSVATDETSRLNNWLDQQYEAELQRSPLTLAEHGRKERYGEVDDFSLAAERARLARLVASAATMAASFDYDLLSPQGQISYDFWQFRARSEAAESPYLQHHYLFDPFHETHTYPVEFLLNYHRVDTEEDMLAYIRRVTAFSRGLEQSLQRAQDAAAMGIRPPRFAYRSVIEDSRRIISGRPFSNGSGDSPIWADGTAKISALAQHGSIDASRARALEEQLASALRDKLMPVYKRLIAWQLQDMANTSPDAQGVHALPDGEKYYQTLLRYYTHSDMSALQIHELGLDEVARIHQEMERIKASLGFQGTLAELFQFVRDDPQFYYADTDAGREAYLARTRSLLSRMDERLPQYFGLLPKSTLRVKRVEPYREKDGAAQFYEMGTRDGSRPGIYYVHLSQIGAYNKTDLEATAYHEGNPGHHMQSSIAMELTDIPRFRTRVGYSAYAEGWALYAELLAKEMGAFSDPYDDFGRLVAEIWRAIRLVVDTGLHAMGWSEEQAVQYMLANSAIPEAAVRSEIRRYLVAPGQATSYKAGMLKILALREQAKAELGESFDIRGFHDAVLGGGSVPLPILERTVRDWVRASAQAP